MRLTELVRDPSTRRATGIVIADRAHFGWSAVQSAGAPIVDGCTVAFGDGRRFAGVAIRLRPTIGRMVTVIGRGRRPKWTRLDRRWLWWLYAPRSDGRWLPARPAPAVAYREHLDAGSWVERTDDGALHYRAEEVTP